MKGSSIQAIDEMGMAGAALLLALGLGTAPAAPAGCNHQVVSRQDPLSRSSHLDDLILTGSSGSLRSGEISGPSRPRDRPGRHPVPARVAPRAFLLCRARRRHPSAMATIAGSRSASSSPPESTSLQPNG